MKAKFVAGKNALQVRLENGTIYLSGKDENREQFLKRVSGTVALVEGEPMELIEPFAKPTIEQILALAKEAKKNKGRKVKIKPHRGRKQTEGVITSVWIDKRVPMALYRVTTKQGDTFSKVINSPDLEFCDGAEANRVPVKAEPIPIPAAKAELIAEAREAQSIADAAQVVAQSQAKKAADAKLIAETAAELARAAAEIAQANRETAEKALKAAKLHA